MLFCDLDLQLQGHWWPLKGQILAIFSHFGPVVIYRKLDHPMAGIYNTYTPSGIPVNFKGKKCFFKRLFWKKKGFKSEKSVFFLYT